MNKNKYLEDFYKAHDEDARFNLSRAHKLEYITTMHYIHKYAKKRASILELGASTGAYSIQLAKEGYTVTAVELLQNNLDVLIKNSKGLDNLTAHQGNALDLSKFDDNSFDVVLNLGPMYHLYTEKDRLKAIKESIRVCKPNGTIIFAYITCSDVILYGGFMHHEIFDLLPRIDKRGAIKPAPEHIFGSYFIEDFEKQFKKLPATHLKNVSADGIALKIAEKIEEMSDDEFKLFIDWHLSTCERLDHQGLSSHMLYICRKN